MPGDHTAESVFGEVAELYDEVRPDYPRQLVSDVLQWSNLPQNARLLEIGCGTGKATRLFAPHGHDMTCVDPAAGMLRVARRTCTEYPNVNFVESIFEDWTLPPEPFDLVYSAQAFHWIDPVRGLAQVANALKPGGAFSLFWHFDQYPNAALRATIDAAYKKFAPNLRSPAKGEKNSSQWPEVVRNSGHFTDIETGEYEWQAEYDADSWVRLLQTHSDHRVLEPAQSDLLLSTIHDAIEASGGTYHVSKTTELVLARKP